LFCSYYCNLLLACFVDCCLPTFRCFDLIVETFVSKFVLVSLFSVVPSLDYNNAFLASTFFWWLLLAPIGGSNMFVLINASFASIITLCDPLKGSSHLFDPFPTTCIYFYNILIYVGSIVEKFTSFSFLRSSTTSSFWINSENYHPHNNFLIQYDNSLY
jgi:hypothetical protein